MATDYTGDIFVMKKWSDKSCRAKIIIVFWEHYQNNEWILRNIDYLDVDSEPLDFNQILFNCYAKSNSSDAFCQTGKTWCGAVYTWQSVNEELEVIAKVIDTGIMQRRAHREREN